MCYNKYSGHQCVSRKKIQKGPVRGDAGKGVKKMKDKIFFGIRTELIEKTKSALRRKADFEKKAEKMSAEQAEQAEEILEEILKDLAFFEAFQKQDYVLDLVFYTGILGLTNILILEPALKLPAGVSYDSSRIQLLAPEKRSEIEEKMREAEDVLLFTSKEEAIKEMTSI